MLSSEAATRRARQQPVPFAKSQHTWTEGAFPQRPSSAGFKPPPSTKAAAEEEVHLSTHSYNNLSVPCILLQVIAHMYTVILWAAFSHQKNQTKNQQPTQESSMESCPGNASLHLTRPQLQLSAPPASDLRNADRAAGGL